MILTNCNCAEKVDCGCTVGFDEYESESISVLSVGNLTGGSCTFDEYVIDWYRDGEHALVSGVGNDPDIEAFHPFVGVESIPVIAGTYIPVIRYVVMGGEIIYGTNKKCKKWCDDLEGLPDIVVITVLPIECGLVGTDYQAASALYDFKLSYNTTQDWALAARRVKFILSETAKYFAFQFTGYEVADQLNIYHSSDLNNPIWQLIIGSEATNQWTTPPYSISTEFDYKQTFELPAYQADDYLIIEIIPSVISSNQNTHWDLEMICLDSSYIFDADFVKDSWHAWDINTISLNWDSINCDYEVTMDFPAIAPNVTGNLLNYCGMWAIGYRYILDGYKNGIKLPYETYARYYADTAYGYSNKIASDDSIFISKSGNVVTFVCNSINDYNRMEAGYNEAMSSSWASAYVNDNTNLNYYRFFYFLWKLTTTSCGDNEVQASFYIHISSQVTFDSGTKTITITLESITNGLPVSGDNCNTVRDNVDGWVNNINNSASAPDYSNLETVCIYQAPFGYRFYFGVITPSTATNGNYRYLFDSPFCTPMQMNASFSPITWFFYALYFQITAPRDANGNWTKPPSENYKVYNYIDPVTHEYDSNKVLIYEIQDAVVLTKIAWEDL